MPQGMWTKTAAGAWPGLTRPAVALTLLALLGACGQQAGSPATGTVTYGGYNRPSSYDPPGPASDPWGPWIREASHRFDVPERWIREVMRQESGGRTGATSRVGAMGLMQVMPGTYRQLRDRYGFGDDPYHPYDSIMAGAAYIREMYDLYGSPAFLAAYNAGPRRLEDYLWSNRGLPNETRNYVARIGPHIVDHHPKRRAAPEIYAAAEIPLNIPAGPRRMDSGTMLALKEQRESQQPGIQQAQLQGQVFRLMEPVDSASQKPAAPPAQFASIDGGPVVRMDPIPDGSTYTPPERSVAAEPPAPPPRPAAAPAAIPDRAAAPVRTQLAALPVPPPRQAPATQAAAPGRSFSLMGTAHASTLPPSLRATQALVSSQAQARVTPVVASAPAGGWALQVGAFASEGQARAAAAAAHGAAGGRVVVQPVGSGRATLYRARVTGLSQPGAQAACDKLKRNGACMVLSPGAQG